ncbi:M3 family metallopeptidase [Iodobacter ciconiae]|uniref:oligopeptidase A n=1 Tax=Iodobacter ciconiae TaxID=2496266 RepID=A0A3S8ZPI3_9NEIS|nr:M3 family metallopeptidase [Iodobacter ciconiae]AZN35381.1 M3 family peptidase [Iodobacter ciconiae]
MTNPLLNLSGKLPDYPGVKPEHINPALDTLLASSAAAVSAAEKVNNPTWANFVEPLDAALEKLGLAWGVIAHLESVVTTPELREVYNANIARISNFYTELGQNELLYAQYKLIAASSQFASYNAARKTIIEDTLRDFRLSGAELPQAQKQRFAEIAEELSELTVKFGQNVMDATDEWSLYIEDITELGGLPQDWLSAAKSAATTDGKSGYKVTLKQPSQGPVMQFCGNRKLRETVYHANATRASEFGPAERDNGPLIKRIHALRLEAAQLLGFNNYGEESLATKMADTPAEVAAFLRNLGHGAKPFAAKDRTELKAFAKEHLGLDELAVWDYGFAAEKLSEAKYAFSAQEVKAYFTEPTVLSGLFKVIESLYSLRFVKASAPVWHPDVNYYALQNLDGSAVGGLYLDLYARTGKQGGAWMNDVLSRNRKGDDLQNPVALVVCNFSAGVDGKPALLTHDDVITLFHEFGHALHHLLTEVDESGVSGINGVEWDAVELPSQFMENFCWEWQVLPDLTRHVDSGTALPRGLFDKMLAAKNFMSGSAMVRQVLLSLFDMELHASTDVIDAAAQNAALVAEFETPLAPSYNRWFNTFSHIFAGGYAAGYYSYKWAEVLSADAYSAFEEAAATGKSILDPTTGARFRKEVLAMGGSRPAIDSFMAFRGRKPEVAALLRHNGLN